LSSPKKTTKVHADQAQVKGQWPIPVLEENIHYYMEDGFMVFTEAYHAARGRCCGNACRHCPYCDDFENEVRVMDPLFSNYGGRSSFYGEAVTVKCFEDNSVVKELVATKGQGRVIVMDGGGSLRRAILGDMLAEKASENGWAGLVINGCIRDCDEIAQIDLGVKALNTHPMKTEKLGVGHLNIPVTFAGQTVLPGNWVYSDNNGIIVSDTKLEKFNAH